jgi:hypothetical protein
MVRMSGAIPPLPQYAFMAWCSDEKAQGLSDVVIITLKVDQLNCIIYI